MWQGHGGCRHARRTKLKLVPAVSDVRDVPVPCGYLGHYWLVRYRLRADALIDADDYTDALRRIGEHFLAWAEDTPDDNPDTWVSNHSLTAPQFLTGSRIHLVPEDAR